MTQMDYAEYLRNETGQWDAETDHYETERSRDSIYMACVNAAARAIKAGTGDRILDAGCGTGMVTRQYAKSGIGVTALDLSQKSLAYVRSNVGVRSVVAGDLSNMPFANEQFNKAICANTLQHLPSHDLRSRSVAELSRVTARNGMVVITAHCLSRDKKAAGWIKEGKPGQKGVQYIYRFEPDELSDLLSPHFRSVSVTGCGLPLPYRLGLSPLSGLAERVATKFRASAHHGHMLLAVCREPILFKG